MVRGTDLVSILIPPIVKNVKDKGNYYIIQFRVWVLGFRVRGGLGSILNPPKKPCKNRSRTLFFHLLHAPDPPSRVWHWRV